MFQGKFITAYYFDRKIWTFLPKNFYLSSQISELPLLLMHNQPFITAQI